MAISVNPVLFADDTSMIVKIPDLVEFTNSINTNNIKIIGWFKSN
jgi:hypothetical protein